jgi:hypothetical protein
VHRRKSAVKFLTSASAPPKPGDRTIQCKKKFYHGCTPIHADAAHLDRLSGIIIGCMNKIGTGFSEKVDENTLAHKVRKAARPLSQQQCRPSGASKIHNAKTP